MKLNFCLTVIAIISTFSVEINALHSYPMLRAAMELEGFDEFAQKTSTVNPIFSKIIEARRNSEEIDLANEESRLILPMTAACKYWILTHPQKHLTRAQDCPSEDEIKLSIKNRLIKGDTITTANGTRWLVETAPDYDDIKIDYEAQRLTPWLDDRDTNKYACSYRIRYCQSVYAFERNFPDISPTFTVVLP